jgi:hydrogenase maturation protease
VSILILGIGNPLLTDDGAGLAALHALQKLLAGREDIEFLDGGTLSFTLAVPIAECEALIVLDAATVGGPPGSVQCYEGDEMDRFLNAHGKASVHEVGLNDLMSIARLGGGWPERRALIGVQPVCFEWGEVPSPAVAASIGAMCEHALRLVDAWQHERGAAAAA